MKKPLIKIGIAIGVMLITAFVAHLVGIKDWETCFSAGVGAGVASLLSDYFRKKRLSGTSDHQH